MNLHRLRDILIGILIGVSLNFGISLYVLGGVL
jgi:hypothetical protein